MRVRFCSSGVGQTFKLPAFCWNFHGNLISIWLRLDMYTSFMSNAIVWILCGPSEMYICTADRKISLLLAIEWRDKYNACRILISII